MWKTSNTRDLDQPMSRPWIQLDLSNQPLDRMRKLNRSECFEGWVYNDNSQYFVTDLAVRLKLIINPKKMSKIKNKITSLKTGSSDVYMLKITIKQYLYSSMIDFKAKNEPYVFMFLEEFDLQSDACCGFKKTEINKLSIGYHPATNKPREFSSTFSNMVTRSASKNVLKENTQVLAINSNTNSPIRNHNPAPKISVKPAEDSRSNLSLLIGQISQDSSVNDYTIEIVEAKSQPADEKPKKPMNLNEAFVRTSSDSMSTLGSSSHTQESLILEVPDTQKWKPKLSSQCAANFSQFEVDCSVINNVGSRVEEKTQAPKSSITITKIGKKTAPVEINLIDSDRDTSGDGSLDPEETNRASSHLAADNRMMVRDTQANSSTQTFPSQILKRRDTGLSEVSGASLFEWPLPGTSFNPFISSTLNPVSAQGKKRRKLLSEFDRAHFNGYEATDDEDDVDESASCVDHVSRSKTKTKRDAEPYWERKMSRASSSSSLSSFDTSLSSSSSSSVASSCMTTNTQKSLLFAPRHLFEYKKRLMARKALSEKKPSSTGKFSARDIFSPRLALRKPTNSGPKPQPKPSYQGLDQTRMNSNILDDMISLDGRQTNHTDSPNLPDKGKTPQKQTTPTRRRLFDPKNQDIDLIFGDVKQPIPRRMTEPSGNMTTATNASDKSIPSGQILAHEQLVVHNSNDLTTASSDKSIPNAQNPIVVEHSIDADKSDSLNLDANSKLSSSNEEKSVTDDSDVAIFKHRFSIDLNEFQDYLAESQQLIAPDKLVSR